MKLLSSLVCLLLATQLMAQITPANFKQLQKIEDSLKVHGITMVQGDNVTARFYADSTFIKMLVRALKTPYSFYYPFDSLVTISKLTPPDSSFRIITWQFERNENSYRQRGAIQMNTKDGSLQLYPLLDMSDFTTAPTDSLRSATNWIGAIYYNIIQDTFNKKKVYTLLGYDGNNFATTKKWIEVLTFSPDGKPIFGGTYFNYALDELKPKQPAYRFLLEYKKEAKVRLTYDQELKVIVFDHLVSETNEPSKRKTLVPDGDYEAFMWRKGTWVHIPKLFNQKIDMRGVDPLLGNAPMDASIRDAKGNLNDQKLQEISKRNMEKAAAEKKAAEEKAKQIQREKEQAEQQKKLRRPDPSQREY